MSGRERVGTRKVASITATKAEVLAEIRRLSAGKHRSYFAAVDAEDGALAGVANNGRLSKGGVKDAVAKLARAAYRLQPNAQAGSDERLSDEELRRLARETREAADRGDAENARRGLMWLAQADRATARGIPYDVRMRFWEIVGALDRNCPGWREGWTSEDTQLLRPSDTRKTSRKTSRPKTIRGYVESATRWEPGRDGPLRGLTPSRQPGAGTTHAWATGTPAQWRAALAEVKKKSAKLTDRDALRDYGILQRQLETALASGTDERATPERRTSRRRTSRRRTSRR